MPIINSVIKSNASRSYGVSVKQFLGTVDENGVYQKPTEQCNLDLSGIRKITGGMQCRFANTSITSVSAPDLVEIVNNAEANGANGCSLLFYNSDISTVSFPALKKVSGNQGMIGFFRKTKIVNIVFPELEEVGNFIDDLFMECNHLESVSFPKLKKLVGYKSSNICSWTKSGIVVDFAALDTFENYSAFSCMFQSTLNGIVYFRALKSSSFSERVNMFESLFSYCSNCTIHFPTNLDPNNPDKTFDASTLSGYPNFSGTNTTVLFDLPATE